MNICKFIRKCWISSEVTECYTKAFKFYSAWGSGSLENKHKRKHKTKRQKYCLEVLSLSENTDEINLRNC